MTECWLSIFSFVRPCSVCFVLGNEWSCINSKEATHNISGSSARQWRQCRASKQRIRAAKNARRSLQAVGLHVNGLHPLVTMHVHSLGVQPWMPKLRVYAIDLSTTELRALDTPHLNLIKWSLALSKLCLSTPLLGVQRIPAMRDHQSVNLLKRCLAGSSAASTFYWSLINNRDIDVKRTLVNKLNLVDNSISRILFKSTTLSCCFMITAMMASVTVSDFYYTT